jgi:hypothetical protein
MVDIHIKSPQCLNFKTVSKLTPFSNGVVLLSLVWHGITPPFTLSPTHTHWFGVEHANDYIIDAVHINKNILEELERKQNEKETFLHRY